MKSCCPRTPNGRKQSCYALTGQLRWMATMNRSFVKASATVLLALGAGCAGLGGPEDEQRNMQAIELADLVGQWSGQNLLWVIPGEPVRESDATAHVEMLSGSALAMIQYTWSYEGEPQQGTLLVRTNSEPDDASVVLVDSWHTGNKFMNFRDEDGKDGLVAVHGTYAAPPGQDWGWRIVVRASSADAFQILMFNIAPDGQEAPAVDATFRRAP